MAGTMVSMTLLPQDRPLRRHDLERLPDDGHRYELIDGSLVVTPAPSRRHQLVSSRLHHELSRHCPTHLVALSAPVDVEMADDSVVQPDLLVVTAADFADESIPVRPLLAVEILSPSTRLIDLNLKRARYEEAGCPSYWVIDPDRPGLRSWSLVGGAYVEQATVEGDAWFATDEPFPISLSPARLLS